MTAGSPARKLSQETTAVLSVGATLLAAFVALAGLILVSTGRVADEARAGLQTLRAETHAENEDLRAEIRANREELRAELRANREELRAEIRANREELRAFREVVQEEMRAFRAEAQADRIALAREITRLAERQGRLEGIVEGLRERMPVPAAPIAADG